MHAEKLLPEGVPSEHSFTHLPSPSSSSSPSNPSPSPPSPRPPPSSHRLLWGVHHPPGALYSFLLLFLIHLTNYADRFIPSAVKAQIQAHYGINDFWSSFSLTAFIIVFMLSCPVFGALSDAGWSRRRLISGAVCAWSLLTAATALAPNYPTFIVIRALMGIGESAYITITPSILSDWYQPQDRSAPPHTHSTHSSSPRIHSPAVLPSRCREPQIKCWACGASLYPSAQLLGESASVPPSSFCLPRVDPS